MALTVNEIQVLWSAANSVSVSAGGNQTSDAFTFTAGTVIQISAMMKGDNAGTPASGDELDFWFLPSLGDPDGASTEEYVTAEQGIYLGRVDTFANDPAIVATLGIPGPHYKGKIYVKSNASSNSITASCILLEQNG